MGDQNFKHKKRTPFTISNSLQNLCFKSNLVAPSTDTELKSQMSSQDELWPSILPDYNFLMADDLITECKETRKELCQPLPQLSSLRTEKNHPLESPDMLTFEEFLDHFNKLHDTLHTLQTSSDQLTETKYESMVSGFQYLKEHGSVLKLMHPDLTEDVNLRITILKNKLQLLEQRLFPNKVNEKVKIIKGLTSQMKEIRKWLQEMEGKLRKLKIRPNCDSEEINEIFSQEKILQREVEGRGKELTAIVRQCNAAEGATVAESVKLRRAAAHLERSWHNVWIRSLEKQCLTEQRLLERQNYENNHRDSTDQEFDEGPLNKHRRLSLDRWTAISTPPKMDRIRRDRDVLKTNDVIKTSLTKDIGIQGNDLIPVNDKCIMVGTTGIAALKAEYGDDFTNFEIIQDVGYSSESSTHLSSDDGTDRYFNIQIYNYTNKCASLKEEMEDADSDLRQQTSLSSSLGSSSGAASFNDSGIGAAGLMLSSDSRNVLEPCDSSKDKAHTKNKAPFHGLSRELCESFVRDVFTEGETDYLDAVLESCGDLYNEADGAKSDSNEPEDLQHRFSGIESDDSSGDFLNRSSFMTSSQLFYKMISVESEIDEGDARTNVTTCTTEKSEIEPHSINLFETSLDSSCVSKTIIDLTPAKDSSSTIQNNPTTGNHQFDFLFLKDTNTFQEKTPPSNNLKRKRDNSEPTSFTWDGGRVQQHRARTWPKRTTTALSSNAKSSRVKRCLFPSNLVKCYDEEASSCDASGETTSSDEGNAQCSSSSSFFDEDERRLREGSVETVLRGSSRRYSEQDVNWLELSPMLLPPPIASTPACLRKGQCKTDKEYRPMSHCGDMKYLMLKASSEGDLRSRKVHLNVFNNSLTNIPESTAHRNGTFNSSSLEYKHRMCSSLPNVLRHRSDSSAEELKTSQSEGKSSRCFKGHDDSLTSVMSHNLSSSSDPERRKKRRNRRKSSGSNRSSRSGLTDSNRSRTRTLTGSIGSRRRHFSQKSDFLEDSENDAQLGYDEPLLEELQVSIKCPVEEINHKTLKDELQLALAESCRNSAALLSPTESDVILTTLEEQSTVSDQVWDNYQDMPYLSEAYSEATVDEDAVRKLTEFGDDYGSAIGQPMRYLDAVDSGTKKADNQKSPSKKSSKAFLTLVQNIDSDSDIEDLHHVIDEAEKALYIARVTLQRRQSGDFFSSTENAELLATCGTHLHCLQTICELIETNGNEGSYSSSDIKDLHDLIQSWEVLKRSIEMYNDIDETISQKYEKACKSIKDALKIISEMSMVTSNMDVKDCDSWGKLQENIEKIQVVMGTLQDTRELLLAVNLQVHHFITEYGHSQEYKDCSLKEDVTELYQKWEDVYEKNGNQLTKMETLSSKYRLFRDKLKIFVSKADEIENIYLNEGSACDKSSNSHLELHQTLQNNLNDLMHSADALKSDSIGTPLWKSIKLDLKDAEQRIKSNKRTLNFSRNSNHPKSSTDEDDAIQKIDKDDIEKRLLSPHTAKKDAAKKSSSRFWRILRFAVPVQLTLVLLFCLACYLEPNCCDRMNNFTFSFAPHLRYSGGPPPV
ncbi:hypothetical protein JTE90_008746 [Oedothorax gibbosus]|uniref:KASH domain-containing protein n=1 Tax=Oedothorax gibbosus TaxID=931172 RepID=A0AAV6URF4_9ARAC|nr:hypothetical protein JTE90_008746 [Oedothorax gibbosus]